MVESTTVRVLLVDDHTVVRSGLGAVLMVSDWLKLVGEAANGEEAIKQCERLHPDIVLMDLMMPVMDGVEAIKGIKKRWPEIRVIALTSFKEKELVEGALKAGATGYLLKNVSAAELTDAIRAAMNNQPSLSPEAAQVLISRGTDPVDEGFGLTQREMEILALMVEGLPNNGIAEKLIVSRSTVKFHVSNVLSKLGVSSRTEAVTVALKQHLVK